MFISNSCIEGISLYSLCLKYTVYFCKSQDTFDILNNIEVKVRAEHNTSQINSYLFKIKYGENATK